MLLSEPIERCHGYVTLKFFQQTIMGAGKGSSSSKRIRILSSKNSKKGRIDVEKTMNPKAIRSFRAKASADLLSRITGKHCSCNLTVSKADERSSNG